jgi:ubiquinone/menaquinone biosynthesis C-methylase UbiE/uncharacterized protein YbaR (Trm112 family)
MRCDLIELLACPVCGGALTLHRNSDGLECQTCAARYTVEAGVPILLAPAPDDAGAPGSSHKESQIAFFDADPADEFGVTRPRGAPALHGWLLGEKFRRSVLGLEDLLPGYTALTVCGGSGLDAEFLARAGARVVLTDISLGVVMQAAERARRFALDIDLVVADAENLPFRDGSVDVTYVHDGLHHLERPALALAEMARISRRAVSVSEPASAVATSAAMRLGLAERIEEAGNIVRRLTLAEIVSELAAHGFEPVAPHRYAMYYRHWPGRAVRMLSRPGLLPLATAGFLIANRLAGRFGNKLAVQAIRVRSARGRDA